MLREDARRLIADYHEPAAEKGRQAEILANAPTFRAIAEEYVAKRRREGRSVATITKIDWLLTFADAAFGDEARKCTAPGSDTALCQI